MKSVKLPTSPCRSCVIDRMDVSTISRQKKLTTSASTYTDEYITSRRFDPVDEEDTMIAGCLESINVMELEIGDLPVDDWVANLSRTSSREDVTCSNESTDDEMPELEADPEVGRPLAESSFLAESESDDSTSTDSFEIEFVPAAPEGESSANEMGSQGVQLERDPLNLDRVMDTLGNDGSTVDEVDAPEKGAIRQEQPGNPCRRCAIDRQDVSPIDSIDDEMPALETDTEDETEQDNSPLVKWSNLNDEPLIDEEIFVPEARDESSVNEKGTQVELERDPLNLDEVMNKLGNAGTVDEVDAEGAVRQEPTDECPCCASIITNFLNASQFKHLQL